MGPAVRGRLSPRHAGGGEVGGGAEGQSRTGDTAIFSRVLYHLSYLGTALDCTAGGGLWDACVRTIARREPPAGEQPIYFADSRAKRVNVSVILVASSEPRAGRSLIAAALAWRMGREGASVTLARLAGDAGADDDARVFAALEPLVSPGRPIAPADIASLGDAVVEAPPGAVAALAQQHDARVVAVAAPGAPPLDMAGEQLAGVVLTRVPAAAVPDARARPGVIAALPEDAVLAAPSVDDIARALEATVLAPGERASGIGRVMIGTVASDAAAPYFGQRARTCVVTRFDKTDVQLAALQTDLACLVLSGGGEPSPYLLDRVAGGRSDVAVLLTSLSTVDAVRAVEGLFGRSRFDGVAKLERAVELLDAAGAPALAPAAAR